MRISEILTRKQTFSLEIFPPRGDLPVDAARELGSQLVPYRPDYVSVTFSAGGSNNSGNTAAIAGALSEDLSLNPMAHLTCLDATRADIDSYLAQLKDKGIDNVLALRGDPMPGKAPKDFRYASDLISHIKGSEPALCVGAACYFEGHVECEDFATSIEHLKAKQDAGADFLVSQLFFDNELFLRFREAAGRARIKIPVCCGIMPFTSVKQIQRMAFTCGATIPARVIKRLVAAGDEPAAQRAAGIRYACEQLEGLSREGVDGLHIYAMNRVDVAQAAYGTLASCGYLQR